LVNKDGIQLHHQWSFITALVGQAVGHLFTTLIILLLLAVAVAVLIIIRVVAQEVGARVDIFPLLHTV
jgi:Zn-dependent protease